MSQEIQNLKNENTILKARIFDFSEALQDRDNQLNTHRAILGEICKLVGIDGSRGVEGEVVVAAVAALIDKEEDPVEDEKDTQDETADYGSV